MALRTRAACAWCASFGFSGQPCVGALCNLLLSPLFLLQQSFSYLPHLGILTLISSTGWPLRLLFPLACLATTPTPCFLRLLVLAFYLRPAVLSTVMDSKQASQANPTIEEIKNWDSRQLVEWILQNQSKLLKDDKLTLDEALFKEGLTEKAQGDLSALTGE